VAIRADGTLWTRGRNDFGQLGLGDTLDRFTPRQVGTGTNWATVSAGTSHTAAIRTEPIDASRGHRSSNWSVGHPPTEETPASLAAICPTCALHAVGSEGAQVVDLPA
jgi:alpha-tubulin suppressor-like RCC1 family protein